jgi:hypothetical protein
MSLPINPPNVVVTEEFAKWLAWTPLKCSLDEINDCDLMPAILYTQETTFVRADGQEIKLGPSYNLTRYWYASIKTWPNAFLLCVDGNAVAICPASTYSTGMPTRIHAIYEHPRGQARITLDPVEIGRDVKRDDLQ